MLRWQAPDAGPDATPSHRRGSVSGLSPLWGRDLAIGDEIGKGRFKHVHRGVLHTATGPRDIVVLRYAKGKSESQTELRTLSLLAGLPGSVRFVPQTFGAVDETKATVVVQERAVLGSLKSALADTDLAARLTPVHRVWAAAQVARAMAFLESLRVVHADLSCRNLLLCRLADPSTVTVKVTDFGLALILAEGAESESRKQPQATRWCAPETVARSVFSFRSDAWALGATFWELFSGGEVPWARRLKRSEVAACLRALAGERPPPSAAAADLPDLPDLEAEFPRPAGCSAAVHGLVRRCLQVDERLRPGFRELAEALERLCAPEAPPAEPASARSSEPEEAPEASTPSTADTPPWPARLQEWQKVPQPSVLGVAELADRLLDDWAALPGDEQVAALACVAEKLAGRLRPDGRTALARELAGLGGLLGPSGGKEEDLREANLADLEAVAIEVHAARALAPLRDVVMRLSPEGVPEGGLLHAPGTWTLRELVGPSLMRQQDFLDEAAAWAALSTIGGPCMLRDPAGVEVAARSWLVVTTPRGGAPAFSVW